jgi:hypothetical protein
MHRCNDSSPIVDSALLYKARQMAKRSRASAACLLCRTSKIRCSDYRPCARCKKSATEVCIDLPIAKTGHMSMMDINKANIRMYQQSSTDIAPVVMSGAIGSDRSAYVTNQLLVPTDFTWGTFGRIAPAPQFDTAMLGGQSSWLVSTSEYFAAPNAQNLISPSNSVPPSDSSTAISSHSVREDSRFLPCARETIPMETVSPEPVDQADAKAKAEQVRPHRSGVQAAAPAAEKEEKEEEGILGVSCSAAGPSHCACPTPHYLAPQAPTSRAPAPTSFKGDGGWADPLEWAWEAAAGPGPADSDPFRADWKHWGGGGAS